MCNLSFKEWMTVSCLVPGPGLGIVDWRALMSGTPLLCSSPYSEPAP